MHTFDTPARAYRSAYKAAGENDRILVFGSFYTVSEILTVRAQPDGSDA
jgi:dihydrofolate synthase/folylpolyglutamate synthase